MFPVTVIVSSFTSLVISAFVIFSLSYVTVNVLSANFAYEFLIFVCDNVYVSTPFSNTYPTSIEFEPVAGNTSDGVILYSTSEILVLVTLSIVSTFTFSGSWWSTKISISIFPKLNSSLLWIRFLIFHNLL